MNMSTLFSLIQNNFLYEQIFVYSTTTLMNYTFKKLNDRLTKKDIIWELMHCLQGAHSRTCKQLNWEYDPNVYINISKELINNKTILFNESTIINIFTNGVGHEICFDDIECWLNNFEIELAAKEHEHLREFIKLKLLIKDNAIPYIERKYIEKFQEPAFPKGNKLLSLYQIYIPNEYKLNGREGTYNDLIELINSFISDDVDSFLHDKNIPFCKNVNTLFIFGHQCTGKSTLVSKILYEHYMKSPITSKEIHVINFSDRNFRKSDLTPREIADYLSIDVEQFRNAVLVIDGLDESEWSDVAAFDKIEQLINDLLEYRCKLVITSRPNSLYSSQIKNAIDITLAPFSLGQAKESLNFYKEFITDLDVDSILQQIDSLSTDVRNIILIPYVLHICVVHRIQLNRITELARLYDIIFSNSDAEFLTTQYNSKQRYTPSEQKAHHKIITEISQHVLLEQNKTISVNIVNKILRKNSVNSNKITSEFLLYRKDGENYAFIHDSIPCYFVAKYLYNLFVAGCETNNFNELIDIMIRFYKNNFVIHAALTFFVEYFSRTSICVKAEVAVEFLVLFLSKKFNNYLTLNSDLTEIKNITIVFLSTVLNWFLLLSLLKSDILNRSIFLES